MPLPADSVLYRAFTERDSRFEGLFYAAVKTTGIFCRPTCTARKPKAGNIEYFKTPKEALLCGYRPCKVCSPLLKAGETPAWLKPLLTEIEANPETKLTDSDLKERGLEPSRIRRWFKRHYAMTFQAYVRNRKISHAFGKIKHGDSVIETGFAAGYESLSGFADSFKKAVGHSPKKAVTQTLIVITRILTPLGPMLAGATEKGVCLLEFVDRRMLNGQVKRIMKRHNGVPIPGTSRHFDQLNGEISEYFEGKRKEFSVPLVISGTPFQKRAWEALQKIPYGQTLSYREQAERIDNPSAARAVARANGDNCIAVIIPCHRVIGKDGNLTGYGGGIWRKKYLLDLEAGFAR